jgi:hypothetical protein
MDYNQSCFRIFFQLKLTLSWLPSSSPCREVILQQLLKQKNQIKTQFQVLVIKNNAKEIYITLENLLLYNRGFFKCQCLISIHLLIYDSLDCFILNIVIYEIR